MPSSSPTGAVQNSISASSISDWPIARPLPTEPDQAGPGIESTTADSSTDDPQACIRCGAANAAERRFCGKCGLTRKAPTLDGETSGTVTDLRLSWWERVLRAPGNTTRASRRSYRRSLPLATRILRWLWALVAVAAVAVVLTVAGSNPLTWVADRWADLRGAVVSVANVRAATEPDAAVITDFDAFRAVDGREDTAWATAWSADVASNPLRDSCQTPSAPPAPGSPGTLLLVPSAPLTLRQIVVAAGLAADDPRRLHQWRPRTLQLAFSDGSCQRLVLADDAGPQTLPVDPVSTDQIRISVVDAFPPVPDQQLDEVALTDVQLWTRP